MVTIPSPPHASSAPDILSNILESQTLLHSKKSIISISVDGNVDYKLTTTDTNDRRKKESLESNKAEKVDLSKAREAVRSVPSYPGQGRGGGGGGGGGWGGGYRGNYHREQSAFRGGYQQGHAGHAPRAAPYAAGGGMRRDDGDYYEHFPRRAPHYPADDSFYERRRPAYPNHAPAPGRHSLGPAWQPPPAQARHSFGGFEDPVDMRMGQVPPRAAPAPARRDEPPAQSQRALAEPPQAYRPLSEPPVFNFQKTDVDKSEDERSDSGLIIDTEKYDPMEPTNDDDSGEEEVPPSVSPPTATSTAAPPSPPSPAPSPPAAPPSPPPALHSLLAGIDASAMNVPPNILDTAVRQVLKEHRNLLSSPIVESRNADAARSDDDSDGDCPNFSIYSATSVHIANNTSTLTDDIPKQAPQDNLEDLVQEDDETPPSSSPVAPDAANVDRSDSYKAPVKHHHGAHEMNEKKKTEEEYKEKISKRCPITTNTRNPIKIKLNTPSLIKRQVTLYDEEDRSPDAESDEKTETSSEVHDGKSNCNTTSPKCDPVKSPDRSDTGADAAENDLLREVEQNTSLSANKRHLKDQNTETQDEPSDGKDEAAISRETVNKDIENVQRKSEENEETVKEITKSDTVKVPVDEEVSDQDLNDDADSDTPETDIALDIPSPKMDLDSARNDDNVEKMTESISETEDERSYTPCLDENRSIKDASFDVDKDKGLEGLGTEMISEEEGNEMFSENERPPSESPRRESSPPRAPLGSEDGEIADKKKEGKKTAREDAKKKKKKDSKKEGKEKSKSKKKGEVSFKKLSKSGKERNYRERDKDDKKSERERERRDSGDESRNRRRKEKRKDLERYDVRTVVTEKRRKQKDPFGRDVSPSRGRSPSLSPPPRSPSPRRRSPSPRRRSPSPRRRSPSPRRRSPSPRRRSPSRRASLRRSSSRPRHSPSRPRRSPSRSRRTPSRSRRSGTPRASPRRRSPARRKRRRSTSRVPRRRSASASPPRRVAKKKKRARSARRALRSPVPAAAPAPTPRPPSPRTPPPTPPPDPALDATLVRLIDEEVERRERRRRDPERRLARRPRDSAAPSKEVFTSGDNILVSVSFKEQERGEDAERRRRRETRRERRRRRRAAPPEVEVVKPVAIIDLDRSPFRELTPSPKNVIVLSDSDHGERDASSSVPPVPVAAEPPPETAPPALGPKTPPSPAVAAPPAAAPPPRAPSPAVPPTAAPDDSPDAYDPFEPTRSPSASASASPASASPGPAPAPVAASASAASASPPRALLTLEAAQRSNLSADDVLDRRPLTPVEKVLALLQSTRDASPERAGAAEGSETGGAAGAAPPPPASAPRIVLPSPTRVPPKLFPGKPSPIKSNPVKPMQALRLPRAPPAPAPAPLALAPGSDTGASPYSPGSSDFGELFEPPPRRSRASGAARVPVRLDRDRKRGSKTQVGVKLDDDNLKILDDLPSSAVEMQVKSKFLKKLNRQERVVEEVKLVLKPHYNKKHVTKEEYKDILRRAVPKICHNKSGEINPTKIQALVEAYVKKFRKKHKLGVA